ncbi:LysM peptidoglycan-binding domain-containing protein [Flavobacterium rhizosphaerae]|uniref:LysM peptidoglycan-binding domain-containing protein n=1 Tax=Flavobacterium rhizosphaerae TaxID=3163298 RepID=A0ABW8Z0H8_9FLAO
MSKRRMWPVVAALFGIAAFAQESATDNVNLTPEVKLSYLDSVKATFVRNEQMYTIDSLWMKELTNEDLFEDMQEDLADTSPDNEVDYNLPTSVLKERLAALNARSPFNIEYSKELENIIKSYLKNRPKSFERLMAISQYYFPMFEEYLAKYNVPLEIKYLAVIESALNPRAKSRVGATGLWQFMYPTGKQYNLDVDSYVDERSDPLKATEAACQYLSSLYKIFGEWDLVLASYNAGPGNVTKAIRRSGSYKNYWNIRKKLPRETQNYVPAFLATMYIYEYGSAHGISPLKAPATYFETDTVMVQRKMSFKQIADLIDVPVNELQFLNPTYKLDVIPYTADKPHFVRLPKDKTGLFVTNEKAIYAYIDHEENLKEKPYFLNTVKEEVVAGNYKKKTSTKTYVVRRGDNLGEIANKYDVSLTNLKRWNGLRGNMIRVGQRLKIQTHELVKIQKPVKEEAVAEATAKEKTQAKAEDEVTSQEQDVAQKEEEAQREEIKTALELVAEQKRKRETFEQVHMYIVQKGDSLFSIARKHPGVTVENLKNWNEIKGESIKPGMKLKVAVD